MTAIAEQTALVPQVVIQYDVSEDQIAKLATEYAGTSFNDPASYAAGVKAIAHVRGLRTSVEARRRDLKEDSLKVGRMIDAAAKKLTAALEAVEEPMKRLKAVADETKEQARRAEEDRVRAEQAAAAKAAQEAENDRLKAEAAKLEAQRAEFAAVQKKADEERRVREEADKAERDRVAAEQRAVQAKLDAERAEVEAKARAIREKEEAAQLADALRLKREAEERAAVEQAERDRVATEETARRIEEARPDLEKVAAYVDRMHVLAADPPEVTDPEIKRALLWVTGRIGKIAGELAAFRPGGAR